MFKNFFLIVAFFSCCLLSIHPVVASAFIQVDEDDDDTIWIDPIEFDIQVKIQFRGIDGQWHAAPKQCCLQANTDFTEARIDNPDDIYGQGWGDSGVPNSWTTHYPDGTEFQPHIYNGNNPNEKFGATGYPISQLLRAYVGDGRLGQIRVMFDCDAFSELELYFEIESYQFVIYKEGSGILEKDKIGPVRSWSYSQTIDPSIPITISTNEWHHFYVEAITTNVLHPLEFDLGNLRAWRKIIAYAHKWPFPYVPSHGSKTQDTANFRANNVDVVIKPDNFHEQKQRFINEYTEDEHHLAAWLRVNDDFSKNQYEKKTDTHTPDNKQFEGKWRYDAEEQCRRLGLIDVGQNYEGTYTIEMPDTEECDDGGGMCHKLLLWDLSGLEGVSGTPQNIPHTGTWSYHSSDRELRLGYEIELEGLMDGEEQIRISFVPDAVQPDGTEVVVGTVQGTTGEAGVWDEAKYTSSELSLMVDGDRSGKFDKTEIRDKHLLFWWNNDTEVSSKRSHISLPSVQSDWHERLVPLPEEVIDSYDLRIHQTRDLEDFAGLKLKVSDELVAQHGDKDNPLEEHFAQTHIFEPTSFTPTDPRFHIFRWPNEGPALAFEPKSHLENPKAGDVLASYGHQPHNETKLFPHRITPYREKHDDGVYKTEVCELTDDNLFIFEAARLSTQGHTHGTSVTTNFEARTFITNALESKYELCSKIDLIIRPPNAFYDEAFVDVSDAQRNIPTFVFFPDPTVVSTATVHDLDVENAEFYNMPDEQCLVFIHGWNNSERDKLNATETFFKRAYWQGYQGRIASFEWPCYVPDDEGSELTFNPSEFASFRSGLSLMNFLAGIATEDKYQDGGGVHVCAHSQGNVATAEAIRLWNSGYDLSQNPILGGAGNIWAPTSKNLRDGAGGEQLLNSYIAMNAALPEGMWSINAANDLTQANDLLGLSIDYLAEDFVEEYLSLLPFDVRTAIWSFFQLLRDRWTMIRDDSNFYQFFEGGSAGLGVPFMHGTDGAVSRKFNYYYTHDTVLTTWGANVTLKGLLPFFPSWDYTYSSSKDPNGWRFSRNNKRASAVKLFSIISKFRTSTQPFPLKVGQLAIDLLFFVRQYPNIWHVYGQFLEMFFTVNEPEIFLGKYEGGRVKPDLEAYEVLSFLSRSQNYALGKGPISAAGWTDKNQVGMDNDIKDHKASHSFFYYHDSAKTRKMYSLIVDDISEIPSTYDGDK